MKVKKKKQQEDYLQQWSKWEGDRIMEVEVREVRAEVGSKS